MKKDRNAFFEQTAYNKAFYPTPNIMANPTPSFASTSSQSYFDGPYVTNNGYNDYNDLDTRLAKIERQIHRLDARINKLENNNTFSQTESINDNTDMYMV